MLLVLYVISSTISEGVTFAAFMVAQLFGVFFCVTLHEYGHAMAARQFGIGTADITLLPIGGVARLHRMPRIAWQEMLVAIAGPAVNILIAFLLTLIFATQVDQEVLIGFQDIATAPEDGLEMSQDVATAIDTMFRSPSLPGYLFSMIVINTMLVLFNMIPAFPMDGGRVLRSFLAMFTSYTVATRFASRIGIFCALLMILFALQGESANPLPILIALFVGFAGYTEAKQVEITEKLRGITVSDAMVQSAMAIPEHFTLNELANNWRCISADALPVTNSIGMPVGIITIKEFAKATQVSGWRGDTIMKVARQVKPGQLLRVEDSLDAVLMRADKRVRKYPVVDSQDRLIGLLDLDTIMQRISLSPAAPLPEKINEGARFDQTS